MRLTRVSTQKLKLQSRVLPPPTSSNGRLPEGQAFPVPVGPVGMMDILFGFPQMIFISAPFPHDLYLI